MNRYYNGVIWTNHALSRLQERKISQGDAWATFIRPDFSRPAQNPGSFIYYRTYDTTKIEVVAKKNEKGQWLILSVWSRSVYDKDKTFNKGNFLTDLITKFLDRFKRS